MSDEPGRGGPPIDWALARRIAGLVAGDEAGNTPEPASLEHAVSAADDAARGYTGLEPEDGIPAPEWVSRKQWAEINLDSMAAALGALSDGESGGPGIPGPAGAALSGAVGMAGGAQIGALVGVASRQVIGQYEVRLLGPARAPRLLFVGANVGRLARSLEADEGAVLRWIVLHEVTHAVHLGAAPWLPRHLGSLATRALGASREMPGLRDLAGGAAKLARTDPRRLPGMVRRSDPMSLLVSDEARALLEEIQAAMASIEGYAEHVMDAAAPALGDDAAPLRAAMDERRAQRPPLARLLGWLLGLELKMRQYQQGKAFCDEVVDRAGVSALNRAWDGPGSLPHPSELGAAERWLARVADVGAGASSAST